MHSWAAGPNFHLYDAFRASDIVLTCCKGNGALPRVEHAIGLLFGLVVHAADIQDRGGAPAVLKSIRHACPWLRHVFADDGYAGPKLHGALDRIGAWTLQIVKRSDTANGFEVLPRRWVVERTFAFLLSLRGKPDP